MHTILEVSRFLGLGRHQTRRRLVASGLPYKIYVKRWKDPATGKPYSRRAIGVPQKTAAELLKQDMANLLRRSWQNIDREVKLNHPEPPPILEKLIHSIGDIDTDRPGCSLYQPRPIRIKMPTIPRFFRLGLARIKKSR